MLSQTNKENKTSKNMEILTRVQNFIHENVRIVGFYTVILPLTIEILHVVSRFDLFKTINRYLLQLVSFFHL